MKKIVNEPQEEVVSFCTLSYTDLIGVEFPSGRRGQVFKIDGGQWAIHCFGDDNNHSCKVIRSSIQNLLRAIRYDKAYLFENKKEFIEWLAKTK